VLEGIPEDLNPAEDYSGNKRGKIEVTKDVAGLTF
jgi:hypothetical protein